MEKNVLDQLHRVGSHLQFLHVWLCLCVIGGRFLPIPHYCSRLLPHSPYNGSVSSDAALLGSILCWRGKLQFCGWKIFCLWECQSGPRPLGTQQCCLGPVDKGQTALLAEQIGLGFCTCWASPTSGLYHVTLYAEEKVALTASLCQTLLAHR